MTLLSGLILAEWTADLVNRGIHLQEKINERPAFADLIRSSLLEAALTLAFVIVSLRLLKEGPSYLRTEPRDPKRAIAIGIGWGLGIFLVATFSIGPMLRLFHRPVDAGAALAPLFADPSNLPGWILLCLFGGGFIEELQRIFCMRIFEDRFGENGLLFAIAATTLIFGFGHLYQGVNNSITIGLTGLCYALLYDRTREPLVPMAAHATFDLLGVGLGFYLLA